MLAIRGACPIEIVPCSEPLRVPGIRCNPHGSELLSFLRSCKELRSRARIAVLDEDDGTYLVVSNPKRNLGGGISHSNCISAQVNDKPTQNASMQKTVNCNCVNCIKACQHCPHCPTDRVGLSTSRVFACSCRHHQPLPHADYSLGSRTMASIVLQHPLPPRQFSFASTAAARQSG